MITNKLSRILYAALLMLQSCTLPVIRTAPDSSDGAVLVVAVKSGEPEVDRYVMRSVASAVKSFNNCVVFVIESNRFRTLKRSKGAGSLRSSIYPIGMLWKILKKVVPSVQWSVVIVSGHGGGTVLEGVNTEFDVKRFAGLVKFAHVVILDYCNSFPAARLFSSRSDWVFYSKGDIPDVGFLPCYAAPDLIINPEAVFERACSFWSIYCSLRPFGFSGLGSGTVALRAFAAGRGCRLSCSVDSRSCDVTFRRVLSR